MRPFSDLNDHVNATDTPKWMFLAQNDEVAVLGLGRRNLTRYNFTSSNVVSHITNKFTS